MTSKRTHRRSKPGELVELGLDEIAAALRSGRKSVQLAAPFLSVDIAGALVQWADEGRARDRRLITAVNVAAVEGGYLDPDAIERFCDHGWDVRSLRNLHAKVALVDARWGIVGSGNLTRAGQDGGNAELGVVLGANQAAEASKGFFDRWWSEAEPVEMAALKRLRRRVPKGGPARRARQGQGGFLKISGGEELERYRGSRQDSGYWLKVLYGSSERASAAYWRRDRWVSDVHRFSGAKPVLRPSYEVGDHLVIYSTRGGRHACPAIVRVTRTPEFEPDRVRTEADTPADAEKWAWVTEVACVAAVALKDAPTLSSIGVHSASVRQHGHIRLSPEQYVKALKAIRGY